MLANWGVSSRDVPISKLIFHFFLSAELHFPPNAANGNVFQLQLAQFPVFRPLATAIDWKIAKMMVHDVECLWPLQGAFLKGKFMPSKTRFHVSKLKILIGSALWVAWLISSTLLLDLLLFLVHCSCWPHRHLICNQIKPKMIPTRNSSNQVHKCRQMALRWHLTERCLGISR